MRYGEDIKSVPDLSNDIILQAKMQALSVFVSAITNEPPVIVNRGEFLDVQLSENQKRILRRWIKESLTGAPGQVRLDYLGVALPPIVEVYGKIALIALALVFMAGRLSK